MEYVYVFAGMLVSIIGLFKRELLVQKQSFRILLGISLALFSIGIVVHLVERAPDSFCGALLAPLPSLGLYRFFRRIFLKVVHHEPKNTYLDWNSGLAADRVFNIAYFGSAVFLELFLIGAVMSLAKAGW